MEPFFSIIIPLYNKADVLSRTLDSILEQSYENFELIIVDDGSTDTSVAVVNAYKDDRIRLFKKQNSGVSDTRNYGAQQAHGQWLFFIDADDTLLQEGLQTFASCMEKYPDAEFYTSNFIAREENGNEVLCCSRVQEGVVEKPFKRLWQRRIFPRTGALVVSKDAFAKAGKFRKECSIWEDLELVIKLLEQYTVVYTPKPVFKHFLESKSLSQKVTPIEKEYAYYVDLSNVKNPYQRLMLLELLKRIYDKRVAMNDTASITLLQKKMGANWKPFLFLGRIERFLLKHLHQLKKA